MTGTPDAALHTGRQLLTDRQRARIDTALADDADVEVEVTWAVYQRIVAAYRDPDRAAGRRQLHAVIDSLRRTYQPPWSSCADSAAP